MKDRDRIADIAQWLFYNRMERFEPDEIGEIWGSFDGLMLSCHRDAHRFISIGRQVRQPAAPPEEETPDDSGG